MGTVLPIGDSLAAEWDIQRAVPCISDGGKNVFGIIKTPSGCGTISTSLLSLVTKMVSGLLTRRVEERGGGLW